jgi:hypothetical protein
LVASPVHEFSGHGEEAQSRSVMKRLSPIPDENPRNNAQRTRGRPFKRGNPGRPKGARHRTTLAVEALLDGEAEKLTRKAIDLGLAGDILALRLCLDRIAPPRRDRPLAFSMPPLRSAADAPAARAAILDAVASGEIVLSDAEGLARLVATFAQAWEIHDCERRLRALEARDATGH